MLFFFFYLLFDLEKSLNGIINYFRNDGRWTIGNGEEDLRFFLHLESELRFMKRRIFDIFRIV